jgi:mRNA interferase RelE/StbE
MAKYKVIFKQSVRKDLRSIPNIDIKRILQKIEQIAEHPRGQGSVKLKGSNYFRVRQGQYRIVYEIRDQELIITVIKVGHRSSVYSQH